MRIRNLVSLELETHLIRPSGQRGPVIIVLNADEVKNATPQEYPLPAETKVLLNSYLTEHRLRYSFEFEAQGKPHRFVGEKVNIWPWNLPTSHTTCRSCSQARARVSS